MRNSFGHKSQRLPRARNERLLTREVADELLVYDQDRCSAHCLNSTAALIWRQCDGRTTVPEITRTLSQACGLRLTDDIVLFALEQLDRARLITPHTGRQRWRRTGKLTRRELIKSVGVITAVGLPLVNSIVAPTTVEAATCRAPGAGCSPNGTNSACCSGTCVLGLCT